MLDLSKIDPILIKGELARRSLKEFVKLFWSQVEPQYGFKDNWHLDVLCEHLTNAFEICREKTGLLITIPPRCSKTLITGVFWPAWLWANRPETKFMFSSYGLDLSKDASVKCRDLILSPVYRQLWPVKIKEDYCTKERFDNTNGGFRLATAVGGPSTGFGADVLVCDDPLNVKKAGSEIETDNMIRWYMASFLNRVNDAFNCARIVIGQRVGRRDLAGFLLENYKEDWVHINLPWEYPHTETVEIGWDKLGRNDPRSNVGQALWPDRFPEQEIRLYKKNRATFETQYNQNPTESVDALFKADNFSYYQESPTHYVVGKRRVPKDGCYPLVSVDLAISTSHKADWTVILTADVGPQGDIFIRNMIRERMVGTKFLPMLVQVNQEYRPHRILIEDVAFQRLVIQQARLFDLPVRGVRPNDLGDKVARSFPLQLRFDNRQVHFPQEQPWVSVLERELLEFPGGDHDDIVDALAWIGIEVSKRIRGLDDKKETVPHETKTPEREYWEKIHQGLF